MPSLANTVDTVTITVAVVLVLLYGNLRGIREAGSFFAIPTYFFIFSLASVIIVGFVKEALGQLHQIPLPPSNQVFGGKIGTPGSGWLMGLAFISLLRSFANGGSSLTGLEAISNGVSSFQRPEAKNARQTLVVMSTTLGTLVLGVTLLAKWTHAVPYQVGSPTVVSQEVKAVFGTSAIGHVGFYVVQLATMLILYTGGNTSFNGFPYLASFVAGDAFLPRQLTRRGHRLAFSNGILVLTGVALALILVYRASVNGLVALYAIGVFTGFTMAGSGMVKHHLAAREGHWRRSIAINGFSAFLSFSVVLIFAVAKFKEGAWLIVVVGPLLYIGLIRLHHQYVEEAELLETGVVEVSETPILRRHVVVVLVDRLDAATARALQYARTLAPDDLRAVHFDIDTKAARELEEEWGRLGLSPAAARHHRVPRPATGPGRGRVGGRRHARRGHRMHGAPAPAGLRPGLAAFPARPHGRQDRRRPRAGAPRERHHRALQRGQPLRRPGSSLRPFGPGAGAAGASSRVETIDDEGRTGLDRQGRRDGPKRPAALLAADQTLAQRAGATTPIAAVVARQRVRVAGRVKSVRVQPRAGTQNLECVLSDGSGGSAPGLPGPAQDRGYRPRGSAGGRGHGRDLGSAAGHAQPLLRAGAGGAGRSGRGLSAPGPLRRRQSE